MRLNHRIGLGLVLVGSFGGGAACGGSSFDEGLTGSAGTAGNGSGTSGSGGASGSATAGKGGGGSAQAGATSGGKGGKGGGGGDPTGGAGGAGAGGTSAGAGGSAGGVGGAPGGSGGAPGGNGGKAGNGSAAGKAGNGGKAGASGAGAGGASQGGTGGAGASGASGGSVGGAGAGGAGAGGAGAGGAGAGGAGAGGAVGGCAPDLSACGLPAGGAGLCVQGQCAACTSPVDDPTCNAAYGQSGSKFVCSAGECIACDAVGTAYVVDPVNGNDALATGSGTAGGAAAPGCSFKTVTAAIAAINGNAQNQTLTIEIVGPSTVNAGETYPLVIPRSTTLTTRVGAVTIAPTGANVRTITLNEDKAGINGPLGLTIDGKATSGTSRGVVFDTGATDATTLKHVRIRRFPGQGIALFSAARPGFPTTRGTVLQGVEVDECGSSNGAAVTVGDGPVFLTFSVQPSQVQTKVTNSPGMGIRVVGGGGIKMTGGVDFVAPAGLIEVTGNAAGGIEIFQGANAVTSPITGVLVRKNGQGSVKGAGIRVAMTSKLVLRASLSLENGTHGVHVLAPDNVLSGTAVAVDLGVDNGFGKNVLQADKQQQLRNPGVGICFSAPAVGTFVVPARGNTFGSAKICSANADVLSFSATCSDADVGVMVGLTSSIDTLLCTQN